MFAFEDLYAAPLDGKYRILRILGQGGMGAVFAAEHLGTGRMVAVKVILPQLLRHREALERFRREARAAGRLRHPNIVDVTDFGVARVGNTEIAYLVMEYLEGTTLRSFIESHGRLAPEVVVAIVEQIALALDAAHAAGMVHRDLKPDNVWLIPDPRGGHVVRVLDFGIAKLRETAPAVALPDLPAIQPDAPTLHTPERPPTLSTSDSDDADSQPTFARAPQPSSAVLSDPASSQPLTVSGSTLGTPAYMSPEQCRGEAVDHRSDIYALGILTYEALAGKRPFSGKFQELLDAHLNATPEPLDHVAGVSPRLAEAVARSLAKSPDERYPSAPAMAGSLYAAIEGPTVILRRAVALYADRFPLFTRIAWRAFIPAALPIALLALALVLAAPFLRLPVLFYAGILSILCWGLMTLVTNAAFAVTIDQLRLHPLNAPTAAEIYRNLKERLGFHKGEAGALRSTLRLAYFYVRSEMRAAAGAGDLAFMIAFLEQLPQEQVRERCTVLARAAGKSYHWIRAMIMLAILVVPFVEGCVLFAIASIARVPHAEGPATLIAFVLIPVNAIVLNPIFGTALALLYFRARQANGEHITLSSVISTGV